MVLIETLKKLGRKPTKNIVYLGLGGNVGNVNQTFDSALKLLGEKLSLIAMSKRIVTKAMYLENQPDFLNMVVKIETDLPPKALLSLCKKLEVKFGRDIERASLRNPSVRY